MYLHVCLTFLLISCSFGSLLNRRSHGNLETDSSHKVLALQQQMPALRQDMRSIMDGVDDEDEDAGSKHAFVLDEIANYLVDSVDQPVENDLKPPPLDPIYDASSAAANVLEQQTDIGFVPEGSQSDLDVSPTERNNLIHAFDRKPDIFDGCLLIHDFATPLRVGSAILNRKTAPDDAEDFPGFPSGVLHTKGGVFDRDAGIATDATPEVSMFAFLQSIAGEVAVIPNGAVARWSSKKKVPIAGYLCTDKGNTVLYTLPTPCLETTLDDDGMPRTAPRTAPQTAAAPSPAPVTMPAPSPAIAAAPIPASAPRGISSASLVQSGSVQNRSVLDPRQAEPPTKDDFVVFVGNKKLYFSSKKKAEKFCHRLADTIADDMGDHEFDTDLAVVDHMKKDTSVTEFLQIVKREPQVAWTTGTKNLLVMLVDWKYGDQSRRPYSRQTKSVDHYRTNIFPRVRKAFQKMSYGKFDISVTFVPEVVRFVKPRSRYTSHGYPFPGIYIGAQEAMENSRFATSYNFDKYDLVYVISPQQAPVGTKGVAWVGAKGAICNGCEEISDNFQVMVAVHELGHNLGLAHAGSKSLEYGNPFDWMGNYPDVQGLSYGAGYKLRLHWLPPDSVWTVKDSDVASLNDRFILQPFDYDNAPASGEISAIQISLGKNRRDLFITYRGTAGGEAGVYIVLQDKGKPDSELIDLGCHTPSQRDARLQPGWTYMDPSSKVVVYLESVDAHSATLQLFAATQSSVGEIRARAKFSDGIYKCPRTCTDSDLLVAQFESCSALAGQGYCRGGKITSSGRSMSVGTDLCPKSCGNCAEVLSGSPEVGGGSGGSGCADRNIKIGGKSCFEARLAGYCDRSTNLGHVGRDLCPKSCGECPTPPTTAASTSSFQNPTPARTHGTPGSGSITQTQSPAVSTTTEADEDEAIEDSETTCLDDTTWTDSDGHDCTVYADFIAKGKLTQHQACNYGDGSALLHCKKTCDACQQSTTPPAPPTDPSTAAPPAPSPDAAPCEDSPCVQAWKDSFGQCHKCEDFKDTYCGHDALFMQSCPKSCNLCQTAPPPCVDDFKQEQCEEWKALDFCDQPKVESRCKKTCGVCGQAAAIEDGGIFGRSAQADAVLSRDEEWEWGSTKALKKPAEADLARVQEKASLRKKERSAADCHHPLIACLLTLIVASSIRE